MLDAPLPNAPLLIEPDADTLDENPTHVLFVPVVIVVPANNPTQTFSSPVDIRFPALSPTAVFAPFPVVTNPNALYPTAVLKLLLVAASNAPEPIAVLLCPELVLDVNAR